MSLIKWDYSWVKLQFLLVSPVIPYLLYSTHKTIKKERSIKIKWKYVEPAKTAKKVSVARYWKQLTNGRIYHGASRFSIIWTITIEWMPFWNISFIHKLCVWWRNREDFFSLWKACNRNYCEVKYSVAALSE